MCDTKFILDAASRLRRASEPFLVATVVRVRGSSYRRPGARMLLTRDRWIAGSVSGGCLEGDVVKKGWWRTREGAPVIVTYDATADDEVGWGFGLGCDGVVDVLLERAGDGEGVDPFGFIAGCVARQERGALATLLDCVGERAPLGARVAMRAGGGVKSDVADERVRARVESECRAVIASGETRVAMCAIDGVPFDVLIEAVLPPLRLFVLGAGHDAVPLVTFARTLGWETLVCQPHARIGTRERFTEADAILVADLAEIASHVEASDRAAAIAMAHDYDRDRASLDMLLRTRAQYIGMLGPRRRTVRMLSELGLAQNDPRVHAPVGLDLGAETPQDIALAIAAEVKAALTRSSGTSLRERSGSIHTDAPCADVAE